MDDFVNGKRGLTLVQVLMLMLTLMPMERTIRQYLPAYLPHSGLSLGSGGIDLFFLGILWGVPLSARPFLPIRSAGKAWQVRECDDTRHLASAVSAHGSVKVCSTWASLAELCVLWWKLTR